MLILGQEGWDEDELVNAVMKHNGQRLRVYSHEMLLATLITGADVFKYRDLQELELFGDGHPGLDYLSTEVEFKWPTMDVVLREVVTINLDGVDWPESGILSHFGYVVGKTKGLSAARRRQVLDRVFKAQLVPGSSAAAGYVAEWGKPESSARLEKMANCLASFCRSANGRSADFSVAIAHWETDLAYLHDRYYVSHRVFHWPDEVWRFRSEREPPFLIIVPASQSDHLSRAPRRAGAASAHPRAGSGRYRGPRSTRPTESRAPIAVRLQAASPA